MKYKAALFDMDGTLVDSEHHNLLAAIELFKRRGVVVTAKDFEPFIGGGADKYIGGVAQKYKVSFNDRVAAKEELYAIYDEIIKGAVKPVKGAHELVAKCRKQGLKIAVATSADHVKLMSNLREFGAIPSDFDAIVQGLEIENKKPHPETFLKAAEKVGCKPEECIVFEDAANGVASAKAGGFTCVAVLTTFAKEELNSADYWVNNLSEVDDAWLGF